MKTREELLKEVDSLRDALREAVLLMDALLVRNRDLQDEADKWTNKVAELDAEPPFYLSMRPVGDA